MIAPLGFKVCYGGRAHETNTVEGAALLLLDAREREITNVRVYLRETLSHQRPLTGPEQAELLAFAVRLARGSETPSETCPNCGTGLVEGPVPK